MSIIRVTKRSRYVVLDKTALEDPRLSLKAKGLHAYLLSKPDTWEIRVEHLIKHHKEGKTAIYSAIEELRATGYVVRHEIRRFGRFNSYFYDVYEVPSPLPGFPEPGIQTLSN